MNIILLQAQGNPLVSQFILIGGILLVFYFFMILPQQRKRKEHTKYLNNMKKGDKVITVGGIHGKIISVDEQTFTIEIDKSTKVVIDKNGISSEASKSLNKVVAAV